MVEVGYPVDLLSSPLHRTLAIIKAVLLSMYSTFHCESAFLKTVNQMRFRHTACKAHVDCLSWLRNVDFLLPNVSIWFGSIYFLWWSFWGLSLCLLAMSVNHSSVKSNAHFLPLCLFMHLLKLTRNSCAYFPYTVSHLSLLLCLLTKSKLGKI